MENNNSVSERKCARKQRRAHHRLVRDMNIKCTEQPTENIVVCNAGLVTGLCRETLELIVQEVLSDYWVSMPSGKSYCFVKCKSKDDALTLYNKIHGRKTLDKSKNPLYLSFVETVPVFEEEKSTEPSLPPGLVLIEEIITPEEEILLLQSIDWDKNGQTLPDLKHRKVKHYGYEFRYDTNNVDPNNPIEPIPQEYHFLQKLFTKHECGKFQYDQLTINHYLPGQGIPPHIDTHSVFEDPILSLSLQSACVMDFKRGDRKISLLLPPRSLLIMSGESRYAWSHGICPRHNDIINTSTGITTQERGTRISFTFRKVRSGNCPCFYDEYCDTRENLSERNIGNSVAPGLESSYVHEVYEQISSHFDETRHKQWPNVSKFIDTIQPGGLLLDVGCGNGKYLINKPNIIKLGCDRSSGLAAICRKRDFEVFLCDCLALPFASDSVDAIISIAVIHHLSTEERRKQAISEMIRVLRRDGRCLIYVWAKEQQKDSVDSTYLKFNNPQKKKQTTEKSTEIRAIAETGLILPVHENRTNFNHSDVLVPWKRKGGGNFLRFYHVFEENELFDLCSKLSSTSVEKIYYDQGNWCAILRKI
ncbi:alkylated DNA repair protein alkB homolog 8 [Venturia canescens]|uniref:alkylated DNA repair protein alkB homolog 8 n=1 Tax=Venturia canescens TaxID=32260 RepID=UPI001C9C0A1F|nr:alkylated DNA repair protein alkB homolog 8 [Venturia canescens]